MPATAKHVTHETILLKVRRTGPMFHCKKLLARHKQHGGDTLLATFADVDTPPAAGRPPSAAASDPPDPPPDAAADITAATDAAAGCRLATSPRSVGKCSGCRSVPSFAGAGAGVARHCGGTTPGPGAGPRAGKSGAALEALGAAAGASRGRRPAAVAAAAGGGARTSCESGAMAGGGRGGAGDAARRGLRLCKGSGEGARACNVGVDLLWVRLGKCSAAPAAGPTPAPAFTTRTCPGARRSASVRFSLARFFAALDVPATALELTKQTNMGRT